jgi:hypothetical protein
MSDHDTKSKEAPEMGPAIDTPSISSYKVDGPVGRGQYIVTEDGKVLKFLFGTESEAREFVQGCIAQDEIGLGKIDTGRECKKRGASDGAVWRVTSTDGKVVTVRRLFSSETKTIEREYFFAFFRFLHTGEIGYELSATDGQHRFIKRFIKHESKIAAKLNEGRGTFEASLVGSLFGGQSLASALTRIAGEVGKLERAARKAGFMPRDSFVSNLEDTGRGDLPKLKREDDA